MKKIALAVLLAVPAFYTNAGGDYVPGRVTAFSVSENIYSFEFEQAKDGGELVSGCKIFKVYVSYMNVPWYSWLPFIDSPHPTRKETKEALRYLHDSFREGRSIYFGYMGSGLQNTDNRCVFNSKGLAIENGIIISYYNQI
jgi:hypothetical protein